jgi:hypothetical protein
MYEGVLNKEISVFTSFILAQSTQFFIFSKNQNSQIFEILKFNVQSSTVTVPETDTAI